MEVTFQDLPQASVHLPGVAGKRTLNIELPTFNDDRAEKG
jgi:hypothetical protein